jgi:orotidine-5'-phosphate decarboxylase
VRHFFDTLHSAHKLAEIDKMKPSARDRLIVALDVGTRAEAISLALTLAPIASWMKIGLQLFTAEGPDVVRAIGETGANVFLDLKLHDIPNTVARAIESVAGLDVQMLTLHLSGGSEMVRAAVAAAPENLLLLGVTVLTSSNSETLREIGMVEDVSQQVVRLAEMGANCGIGGIVASAQEIGALRKAVGQDLILVVPGIRPRGSDEHDQKRTMTSAEAIAAGADYLVVGRPITAAPDPGIAARKILGEIESCVFRTDRH